MTIARIETFVLGSRSVLVRIENHDGAVGWGEPVVEGWAHATRAVVERMSTQLLGRPENEIGRLWQRLTRGGFYRGGPLMASAVAGIDQALWDLKGRTLGVPIHELLGGAARDSVRVYAHASRLEGFGDPDRAARLAELGYDFVKFAPEYPTRFLESPGFVARFAADLARMRDAVGDEVDLAVDLHGRFSPALVRRCLPALEEVGVAFVEEPTRPEHGHQLADLVARTPLAIATGERLYSREEFRPVLEAGVAVLQPDLSHAGGISECLRIAALAGAWGARLAPHCPLGPVALAACLQLDLVVEEFYVQEQGLGLHYADDPRLEMLRDPGVLHVERGTIARPTGPGLGIDVDEAVVRRLAVAADPEPPHPAWSDRDGSFAEW